MPDDIVAFTNINFRVAFAPSFDVYAHLPAWTRWPSVQVPGNIEILNLQAVAAPATVAASPVAGNRLELKFITDALKPG